MKLLHTKLKYFSLRRHPSQTVLVPSVETCLKCFEIISKACHIAADEYFPTYSVVMSPIRLA